MEIDSTSCKNCGASNWTEVMADDYPERRRERDRTVKHIFVCDECGSEGRYFEHNNGEGPATRSGAMR